jgi:hypothetical protein
LRIVP